MRGIPEPLLTNDSERLQLEIRPTVGGGFVIEHARLTYFGDVQIDHGVIDGGELEDFGYVLYHLVMPWISAQAAVSHASA